MIIIAAGSKTGYLHYVRQNQLNPREAIYYIPG